MSFLFKKKPKPEKTQEEKDKENNALREFRAAQMKHADVASRQERVAWDDTPEPEPEPEPNAEEQPGLDQQGTGQVLLASEVPTDYDAAALEHHGDAAADRRVGADGHRTHHSEQLSLICHFWPLFRNITGGVPILL